MTIDPTQAIHTWSLFRTLGSFATPGTMPALEGRTDGAEDPVALLGLSALLASHGWRSAQICHFSLPSTDSGYLADLRRAFTAADVALECFLLDHGDLADRAEGERWRAWIDDSIGVAEQLGAPKVRVSAGDQPPSPETIASSAASLRALAAGHQRIRALVENWQGQLVDADSTLGLLTARTRSASSRTSGTGPASTNTPTRRASRRSPRPVRPGRAGLAGTDWLRVARDGSRPRCSTE